MENNVKNRLIYADSLKGLLMILVIVGHAIQCLLIESYGTNHLWNIIYSFHMPAFFAVSGWLAYRVNKPVSFKACKRRFFQIMVPYIIWRLIAIISTGSISYSGLITIISSPETGLWFLWTLFWICIFFMASQWLAQTIKIDDLYIILFCTIFLMGIMIAFDVRAFAFQYISYYFIFYVIGYVCRRFTITKYLNKYIIILIALLWFGFAWNWNMHTLPEWANLKFLPVSITQYLYRGITAMLAIFFILSLAPKFLNSESKINRCVSYIGTYSLGFYVIQPFIIGNMVCVLKNYFINDYSIIIVASILCILVCIIGVRLILFSRLHQDTYLGNKLISNKFKRTGRQLII